MRHSDIAAYAVLATAIVVGNSETTRAEEFWRLRAANVMLYLDRHTLQHHGLTTSDTPATVSSNDLVAEWYLTVENASELSFSVDGGRVRGLYARHFRVAGRLHLATPTRGQSVFDLVIPDEELLAAGLSLHAAAPIKDVAALELHGVRVGFDGASETLSIPGQAVKISANLAAALGEPGLAGLRIGWAVASGVASWEGGEEPAPEDLRPGGIDDNVAGPSGGDVTFCALDSLGQWGRSGDIVGLSVGTTSWNVGTADLVWFASPDTNHPFIVMNLYRLKDDRFEQIGQSWVKHGFYALSDEQCGTECTFEPGHGEGDWLGVGCTDTYTAGLNALQSALGPRYEINPWTGDWTYAGSHREVGHSHDGRIEHRLQVHDSSLDPASNVDATYYAEGYYVMLDDVDVMNNAAWKPVTVSGSPGGTWTFGMSSFTVPPKNGFALDAWPDARETVLAQEVPVVEFVSPDGRSVLSAKATLVGGDVYHYEYALLNIDMHRKVGSFSISIGPNTVVSNTGFHAVESHDEPFANDPWTVSVTSSAVSWSTVSNPLRWGTLYNFRFDADSPPADTTVTLGLFELGPPGTVTGVTTGPQSIPIPTVSHWGMIAITFLLMTAGTLVLRRRGAELA